MNTDPAWKASTQIRPSPALLGSGYRLTRINGCALKEYQHRRQWKFSTASAGSYSNGLIAALIFPPL